ncbi:hypothetical protein ABZ746_36910 [Streptomyces sp. NPDC020096]
MLLARLGRPLWRRVITVAVTALMATAASPGAWQTAMADTGRPSHTGRPVHTGRLGGTALAWGLNSSGQLGDGTTTTRTIPVLVCAPGQTPPCNPPLQHVRAMAGGGSHSLALLNNGTVLAWGLNSSGQLGDGTTTTHTAPVRVCAPGQTAPCTRFLTGVRAIAAGFNYSLALLRNGTVLAWGGNGSGQLGDGTLTSRSIPVRVCAVGQTAPCTRFLTHVRAISAQSEGGFSMALRLKGTVVSWGGNSSGQLGDGTTTSRSIPVRVCAVGQTAPCTRFLRHVRAISAGSFQSLALRPNGTVLSWGDNSRGEVGDGTRINRTTPVLVCAVGQTAPCTRFLTDVHAIAGGGMWSLALRSHGAALSWGLNAFGDLGDGTFTDRTIPVRVCAVGQAAPCTRFLTDVRALAAGGDTTLALRERWAGRALWRPRVAVLAWGRNSNGQVGDGTFTNRTTPVLVCAVGQTAPCTRFLTGVRSVAAGDRHSLAISWFPRVRTVK